MNISWTPGSSGPEGLISLRLRGGPQKVTIAPDIASECLSLFSPEVLEEVLTLDIIAGIHRNILNFNWTVPTSLPVYPFYDLEIVLTANDTFFTPANSDFAIDLAAKPTTSSSTSTPSSTPMDYYPTFSTPSSSPTPTPSTTPPPASGGLSVGAKAGISAGSGAVGLALLVLIGILIFRRCKRSAATWVQAEDKTLTADEKEELKRLRRTAVAELGSTPASVTHEMAGGEKEELEALR